MSGKIVLTTFFLTVLIGTLGLSFEVQRVEASGTIYIRADGSIDPPTAPISTVDNVTYTFTGNIYDSIVVERDYIVVDGAGYTVQGTGSVNGIDLTSRSNVTIKNTEITTFYYGIELDSSSNNSISGNTITNNGAGIRNLDSSSNNSISGNTITANNGFGILLYSFSNYNSISGNTITANIGYGIYLGLSSNYNSISGNTITNNDYGIYLYSSSNNSIFHNNFVNNKVQVYSSSDSANIWDGGFPSGGNYWSDYNGTDANHDGIGDTAYVIDGNNTDHYPLMVQYAIIPEFPSIQATMFFMLLTLLTVIIYKKKGVKTSQS